MSSDDPAADDAAPGWEAIDAALGPIYGGVEPFHYGNSLPYGLGGEDPLHGISVYHRTEPLPHFHYVTYGFSDLWGEGELGGDFSKFGFELTFRLACSLENHEPPAWPLNFLQNIARYVFKSGNHFEAGHHVSCNGPIALDQATEIAFIAFAKDPELGTIETPYGRVEFLQVVGLCADEYETIKHWRTDRFLEVLGRQYPLLITDLARGSILQDDAIAQEQGNACTVIGQAQAIVFAPAEANGWHITDNALAIELTPQFASQLRQTIRIERGHYRWPELPGLVLEVVPTEIKDQDGQVVMVIG